MRTIRFKITAVTVVGVAFVLALTSVVVVSFAKHRLIAEVDRSLTSSAAYVVSEMHDHRQLPPDAPSGTFGEMLGPDGRLLGASANLQGLPPLVSGPVGQIPKLSTRHYPGLGWLRVIAVRIGAGDAPVLVEALQVNQAVNATRSLSLLLAIGDPLLTIALGIVVWMVVGRTMRPVDTFRREVAGIAETDLRKRLAPTGTDDEFGRLVETMNAMLDRLEASVTRERQFVADASHELRSPIAAVQALVEVASSDPGARPEALQRAGRSLQRLKDIAEDLLMLSSERPPPAARPVDVDELVLSQVADLRRTTPLLIDATEVTGAQVSGDEVDLGRVIANLASNAVRHANSKVSFSLHEDGSKVLLTVTDDGPGIPPEKRSVIFDRFSRLDDDRSRERGGAGLGLAIVNEVLIRHGGSIHVEDGPEHGARFIVTLPARVASHPQPIAMATER